MIILIRKLPSVENDADNGTVEMTTVTLLTEQPPTSTTVIAYRPITEKSFCLLNIIDPNVFVFVGDVRIEANSTLAHGTKITVRCRDIGRYKLVGPRERECVNGMWNKVEPVCMGLSQEYNYSCMLNIVGFNFFFGKINHLFALFSPVEKAPTILFRNQLGPIAQSPDGKLIVYPGTILHLDCLWKRRHGTPVWSWNHPDRFYLQCKFYQMTKFSIFNIFAIILH